MGAGENLPAMARARRRVRKGAPSSEAGESGRVRARRPAARPSTRRDAPRALPRPGGPARRVSPAARRYVCGMWRRGLSGKDPLRGAGGARNIPTRAERGSEAAAGPQGQAGTLRTGYWTDGTDTFLFITLASEAGGRGARKGGPSPRKNNFFFT